MPQYSGSYATPRLDLGEAFHEYMYDESHFIGGQAFGLFDTPKKEATFSKLRRESLLRPASDLKRAPKAAFNRDEFDAEDQAYSCQEYATEVQLDHSQVAFYQSDFDAELVASQVAWFKLMTGLEQRVAAILFDGTTNFTVGNGLRTDVSAAWGTATTDIIGDIQTAKEAVRGRTGVEPDTLVIGAGVVPFFLRNDDIRDAMKYTQLASIEAIKANLSAIFGLDKILIGKSVTNTANEGQDASISDVWSNIWASVCKTASPGAPLTEPCVGRSMLWTADTPDAVTMKTYEEPQTNSTVIQVRHHMDELLIDANFAQLLDIAA